MRGGALAVLVSLAALAASCQSRDHSNPFDPANPGSHGVPLLLAAHAADRQVDLVWDFGGVEGIRRVEIRRRLAGCTADSLLARSLDPSIRSFTDFAVRNGWTYQYRLDLEERSGAMLRTEWDEATPSDAIPWVADGNGGGLTLLTADARHVLSRYGSGLWFLDVAADSVNRRIWTTEYLDGDLLQFSAIGEKLFEAPLSGARAVAVDSAGVWAGSFDTGRVERRTLDGALIAADSTGGHVEGLFSFRSGEVWAAMLDGNVRIYEMIEGRLALVAQLGGFQRPVAIAKSGGRVFVLDRGARVITALDPRGDALDIHSPPGLVDPTDIAPDGSGGVWVADGRGTGLVHFDADLQALSAVILPGVLGVTWDRGTLWVSGTMGVQIRSGPLATFVSGVAIGPRPIRVVVLHNHPAPMSRSGDFTRESR